MLTAYFLSCHRQKNNKSTRLKLPFRRQIKLFLFSNGVTATFFTILAPILHHSTNCVVSSYNAVLHGYLPVYRVIQKVYMDLKILFLEDSEADFGLVSHVLKKSGLQFQLMSVDTEAEFVD